MINPFILIERDWQTAGRENKLSKNKPYNSLGFRINRINKIRSQNQFFVFQIEDLLVISNELIGE